MIFSPSSEFSGGTRETAEIAKEIGKPLLHLMSSLEVNEAATQLNAFIEEHDIVVLNVAGPRGSEEPETGRFVEAVLSHALKPLIR